MHPSLRPRSSHLRCAHPSTAWQEDGFTYERKAISKWLKDHDTSPLTGQPLAHKELTANLVLRGMIREWRGPAAP